MITSLLNPQFEGRYAVFKLGEGYDSVILKREVVESKVSFFKSLLHETEEKQAYQDLQGKKAIEVDLTHLKSGSNQKIKPEVLKAMLLFMATNEMDPEIMTPDQIIEIWTAAEKLSFKELQEEVEFKIFDILRQQAKDKTEAEAHQDVDKLLEETKHNPPLQAVIHSFKTLIILGKEVNPALATAIFQPNAQAQFEMRNRKIELFKAIQKARLQAEQAAINFFLKDALERLNNHADALKNYHLEHIKESDSNAIAQLVIDYFFAYSSIIQLQLSISERQRWEPIIGREKMDFYEKYLEHLRKKHNLFDKIFSLTLIDKNLVDFYAIPNLKPHIDRYIANLKTKKSLLASHSKLLIKTYDQLKAS